MSTSPDTAETPPADVDPDGVARLAYDLIAPRRGGFSWDPSAATASTGDTGLQHWVYGGLMRPGLTARWCRTSPRNAEIVDPNTIEVVLREGVTLPDGAPSTPSW